MNTFPVSPRLTITIVLQFNARGEAAAMLLDLLTILVSIILKEGCEPVLKTSTGIRGIFLFFPMKENKKINSIIINSIKDNA